MDRFRAIEAFRLIVDSGSYTRAAKILGMSRSHVSKAILDLEAHLGVRLLNRTTKQVRLTELGQDYYANASRLLDSMVALDESIRLKQRNLTGGIKLLAPKSFGAGALVPIIKAFGQLYRDVEITIYLLDQDRSISEHGFDLVLRYGPQGDSSLISRRLCGMRFLACAAPEYLSRNGVPRLPSDLTRHECLRNVISAKNSSWTFHSPQGDLTVPVHGALASNSSLPLREAALNGMGIGLFPAFSVAEDLASGRLVEVLGDFPVPETPLYAVYPDRILSARLRVFVDFLADSLAEPKES
jgi:DNA-binding transcriptional LysR family regulator